MQFEKIKSVAPKIPELVMKSLLSAIDSGNIKLNEELPPERELAALLSVGRGSLRECLAILEFLGIIESNGKRKVVVKTSEYIQQAIAFIRLSERSETMDDFIEFRRTIEVSIVQYACERATDEDIAALEESVELFERDPGNHNADVEFHTKLANASHNVMFAAVLALLNGMIADLRIRFFALPQYHTLTLESHRRIFKAVANRDKEAAKKEMSSHLDNIQSFSQKPGEM